MFLFLCWNYCLAEEQNQTQTSDQNALSQQEQFNSPEFTVTENDRMEFRKSISTRYRFQKFIFKNKEYNLLEIKPFFDNADNYTKNVFNMGFRIYYYDTWVSSEKIENAKIFLTKATEAFNKFLATSIENRKKISKLLQYLTEEEVRKKRDEEKQVRIKYSKDFWFIGFKGDVGVGLPREAETSHYLSSLLFSAGGGFRVAGFFQTKKDYFRIGFIADFVFKNLNSYGHLIQELWYLGPNLMLGMKITNFYFGVGWYLHFKLSGVSFDDTAYAPAEYNYYGYSSMHKISTGLIDTGPILVFGWMPEWEKFKIFLGFEVRYGIVRNYTLANLIVDKISGVLRNACNAYRFLTINFEFGIGF